MPLPYGPAPSPDKPIAKAHPSFQGVHSLVISSGWRWGDGEADEKRAGKTEFGEWSMLLLKLFCIGTERSNTKDKLFSGYPPTFTVFIYFRV